MNFKQLKSDLSSVQVRQILFVGLGNPIRADDYAGIEFVNRLKQTEHFKNSSFLIAGTNPENHLERIINSSCGTIIFVDTADNGKLPGEIFWIDENGISNRDFSTHAFSLSIVGKYLRMQREMNIMYLGIQRSGAKCENEMSDIIKNKLDYYFKGVV